MSGSHEKSRSAERELFWTLALSTLAFLLVLGGALLFAKQLPQLRLHRLTAAMELGDLDRARKLIDKLTDPALARDYRRECDYLEAQSRMEQRDWSGARALLAGTGDYRDAAALVKECDYQAALTLEEQEQYAEAAAAFRQLGNYQDAAAHYDSSRYALAQRLKEQGELAEAAALFRELGTYGDSEAQLRSLALAITGLSDVDEALASLQGLSLEELEGLGKLAALREELPRNILAVGFYHTQGLKEDGTVLACGDDSFGQCQVGAWSDVTAVAAGAWHSLGLRADGTVYACGRGDEGQCEVSGWTDVVQIAAADYASFGLCRDGSILYCGWNDYAPAADWADVTGICGGSYGLAALRSDGTVLAEPGIPAAETLSDLVYLCTGSGYAAGLRGDGRVRASAFSLDEWKNIVAISGSGTALLGLEAGGTVCGFFFRPGDAVDLSGLQNVAAIAAGGTHFAFAHRDGTVTVLGERDKGQADTEAWVLFESEQSQQGET